MSKKNIIFDFAGTIADLLPLSEDILDDFLKKNYEIEIDKKFISNAYHCIDRSLFYSSVNIIDKKNKKTFYKNYNDLILKNLGLFTFVDNSENQIANFFLEHDRHWTLKSDVIDTFSSLKDSGLSVSILSNFDSKLVDIVENLKLGNLVDNLHISQDVGYEKPQIEFYHSFFDRFDLNVDESLYMGDSYELDYLPASEINLDALLIDGNKRYHKMDYVVHNVSDILNKLG